MPIRLSGMNSGLDTDSIIKDLVAAYRTKSEKYTKQKTKVEWKKEAWENINTKIYNLYKKTLWNMSLTGSYEKKKTTVSDESKASVVAANSSVNGSQELEVNHLAKSGYLTGGVITDKNGNKIVSKTAKDPTDTKLSELDITFPATIKVAKGDGTTAEIELTAEMTMKDVASKFKEAGLSANFDEKNQRFYVSSKDSGKLGDFNLLASNDAGLGALKSLGLYSESGSSVAEYEKWATYTAAEMTNLKTTYANGLDAKAAQLKKDAFEAKKTQVAADLASYKKIIADTPDLLDDFDEKLQKVQADLVAANASGSTATQADKDALQEKKKNLTDDRAKAVTQEADAVAKSEDLILNYYDNIDGGPMNTTEVQAASDAETDAQIQADKDAYNNYVDTQHAYAKSMFQQSGGNLILDPVTSKPIFNSANLGAKAAVKLDGQDSEIILNGATYTSETNSYSVNGLTITVKDETEGVPVTLATDTDVDGIYNSIKGFIKEYNELIKEMDELYGFGGKDPARGYEPLTDEEKDAMSEGEIEKWESKIKGSVLRRDSTLGSITSIMKNSMMMTELEVDGQKYSLSSFGIGTGAYSTTADGEKSILHINGDADDSVTQDKADKLKTMIASDPELVTSFFSKLADDMYDKLGEKMKSTEISGFGKVYSNVLIDNEITDYEKKIDKWEKYVTAQEDSWYKKFTAMEKALSQLQSSTSAISSLLGGGQ